MDNQLTIFGGVDCERVRAIKKLKVHDRKIKTFGTNWICVQPKLKNRRHIFTYAYWYNIETKMLMAIPTEKAFYTMIGKFGIDQANNLYEEFGRVFGRIEFGWIRQTKGWLSGRISGLRLKHYRRRRHGQWVRGMAQHKFAEEDTTDYEEIFGEPDEHI
ncbi:hypothetical protein [uncultured Mediterranean phage uvMED]|nr:hypothetical protein [uncultured Mediterranean phage uvMED]BAR16504.1 hypothetical protein [uncultured Mediterranean phage uvMED]